MAEMLSAELPAGHPAQKRTAKILEACDNIAALTADASAKARAGQLS